MSKNSIKPFPENDGNPGVKFSDIFVLEDIQRVQDAFSDATGVASVITTLDKTPITTPSNFQRLCSGKICKSSNGMVSCFESEFLFNNGNKSGPVLQPCHIEGLWDAAAPITVGDIHIANWIIGQVRDESTDENQILKIADEIGVDREDLLKAFHELPVMSEGQFVKVSKMLFEMANEISEKAYTNWLLKKHVAEHETANELARKSEEKYHLLFANNPQPMWIVDIETLEFLDVNQAAINHYGFSRDEFLAMTINDIRPPEDKPAVKSYMEKISSDYNMAGIWRHKKKNGEIIHVEIVLYSVVYQNRNALHVLIHDISERRKVEETLLASEERYRTLFEQSNDAIFLLDINTGKYLDANKSAEIITGKSLDELKRASVLEVAPKGALSRLEALRGSTTSNDMGEVEYVRTDGTIRTATLNTVPLREGQIFGIAHDITERKEHELELYESQALYRDLVETSQDLIWVCDDEGRYIYLNPAWEDVFGYTTEEMLGKKFTDFQTPEQAAKDLIEFSKLMEGNTVKGFETIHQGKDGNDIHLIFNAKYIADKSGNITGTRGTAFDNTDRKKAEEKILISEEKFAKLFRSNPDVVVLTRLSDGAIIEINDNGCDLIEYSREEILEQSTILLNFWLNPSDRLRYIEQLMTNRRVTNFETSFRTKSGKILTGLISGEVIEIQKVIYILGIIRNITDRKNAEEELALQKYFFEQLFIQSSMSTQILDKEGWCERINPKLSQLFGVEPQYIEGKLYNIFKDESIIRNGVVPYLEKVFYEGKTADWEVFFDIGVAADSQNITVKERKKRWYKNWAYSIFDENQKISHVIVQHEDITERKQADEALKESEALYRNLVEVLPDGVYKSTHEGRFVEVNPAMVKMLGYDSREELMAIDIKAELYFDPEDRESVVLQEKQEEVGIYRLKKKDGSEIWVEDHGWYNTDENENVLYHEGIMRDVTERKYAETVLKESEEKYRNLSESLSELMYRAEPISLKATYVNRAIEDIYGYTVDEWLNGSVSWENTIHPDDKERVFTELANARQKREEAVIAFRIIRKDDKVRWVEDRISWDTDKNGNVISINGLTYDITDRKKTEDELVKAKEKAEESDRLKSAFLANMSHEIRTPMNGILGFAELLKEPELSGEKQLEYIQIIKKSGDRMLNIINDIVDISKIEAGLMSILETPTNINTQIEEVYSFFNPEAQYKGISLSVKTGLPSKASVIVTDREKIYAILTNLVKNAVKYCDKGSIEIGYVLKNGFLEFFVRDTGLGIPADRQEAIFDRFIQADIADTRAYQGAGLGLSISKSYVEMLGGKIRVESETGKGSVFYFTIPYHVKHAAGMPAQIDQQPFVPEQQLSRLKVLLVEDDENSELLIKMAIKNLCREIISENTGKSAVETCRNNPDIDLILMDIKMPDMDGYEATRLIRQFNPKVIIIAQTAFGLAGERENALSAGCTDYLAKPINIKLMRELIRSYFTEKVNE